MSLHPDKKLFELHPELKRDLDAFHEKLRKAGLLGTFKFD